MSLFETSTKGAAGRRWPLYVIVAAVLLALALIVEAFLRAETFSAGREEIPDPGIQDVAVSAEDGLYPPPDTSRFAERPGTVFVYLSVEDLPGGEAMEARVRQTGSGSIVSMLSGGGELVAYDDQEDLLSSTQGGTTGVVKFALGTRSGEPVPSGNYTLEIHGASAAGEEALVARKLFVVEE